MLHSQGNQKKSNPCFSVCILLVLASQVSTPFITASHRPPLQSTQDGLELVHLSFGDSIIDSICWLSSVPLSAPEGLRLFWLIDQQSNWSELNAIRRDLTSKTTQRRF